MFFIGTLTKWWMNRSRFIFHFWDGSKWRRYDPIAVGIAFESACPDRFALVETLFKDSSAFPPGNVREDLLKQQKIAGDTLAAVSRKVFDIPPLSDTNGMTDGECIKVLTKYMLFMSKLGGDAELFVDSPVAG